MRKRKKASRPPCEAYHAALEARSRPAMRLRKLLRQLEMSVPTSWRPLAPRETYAVHTIPRLIEAFGEPNVIMALRLIVETSEANAREAKADVITAMTLVVSQCPNWLGLNLFEAVDGIDIGALRAQARRLSKWPEAPTPAVLYGLLLSSIQQVMGPP